MLATRGTDSKRVRRQPADALSDPARKALQKAPFTGSFDVNRPMPNVRLEYLEVLAFGEHAHSDDYVTFRLGGEIAVRVRAGSRQPFGAPADARVRARAWKIHVKASVS